jgi:hypothetical protein
MAFNVSALTDYVKQDNFPLIRKSIFGGKTASLVTKQTGIKSSATINIIDVGVTFQANTGCSFDASGDDVFTQRVITVGDIKVDKVFCPKTLEAKYTQIALQPGQNQTALPFEEEITDSIAEKIASGIETALWQGDTGSGNANLNKFDGYLVQIEDCGGAVTGSTASSSTPANLIAAFNSVYAAIPVSVFSQTDTVIFVGMDRFRSYMLALTAANLYHYTGEAANFELTIPGTTTKVIGVNGLNGTNKIVAGRLSNFYMGVDLEHDSESFDIWESKDDQNIKLSVKFSVGANIAFCDEVVVWTLA